ncbi:MAG: nickel pincer cofactor biosynthesis protein LarC [bacterium]
MKLKNCKIAYFDCSSGLAGNMILGALVDAELDKDYLKKELQKLDIGHWKLDISKRKLQGTQGTYLQVKTKKEKESRTITDITAIISKSKLAKKTKKQSISIFKRLAQAEAKVHNLPVNKVHFHEVGAIDAIVDIVGSVIAIEKLGIEAIYCSQLPHGRGVIKHSHGILPNPAPATAELCKGIPTYGTNIKGELVTPTGAAIITTLAASFGDMPRIKVESIGYGAGSKKFALPNFLRVFIGEAELPTEKDAILQIDSNIDDMNPKDYDRAIAKLMKAGALDASIHPIRMKKQRKAVKLEVLCKPKDKDKILRVIFSETTTIGTRAYLVKREKLRREIKKGEKISYLGAEIITIKKESL